MTTLTPANTAQVSTTANFAQYDGQFDAIVGLLPANTDLGSTYFQGYIKAVVSTGVTPF